MSVIILMIYYIGQTMTEQTRAVQNDIATYLIAFLVIVEFCAFFITALTNPGYVSQPPMLNQ